MNVNDGIAPKKSFMSESVYEAMTTGLPEREPSRVDYSTLKQPVFLENTGMLAADFLSGPRPWEPDVSAMPVTIDESRRNARIPGHEMFQFAPGSKEEAESGRTGFGSDIFDVLRDPRDIFPQYEQEEKEREQEALRRGYLDPEYAEFREMERMKDRLEEWERRPKPLRQLPGGQPQQPVEERYQELRKYLEDPMMLQQNDPFPLAQYMNTNHASTRQAPDRQLQSTEYPSLKRYREEHGWGPGPSSPSAPPSPSGTSPAYSAPSPPPLSADTSCQGGFFTCWWQANKEFFFLLFHQDQLDTEAKQAQEGKWSYLFTGQDRSKYLWTSLGGVVVLLLLFFFLFRSSSGARAEQHPPDQEFFMGPVTMTRGGSFLKRGQA